MDVRAFAQIASVMPAYRYSSVDIVSFLTTSRFSFSIPGVQPLFQSIGVGTAGAVFRSVGELHYVFPVIDAAQLHNAARSYHPGTVYSKKLCRVELLLK